MIISSSDSDRRIFSKEIFLKFPIHSPEFGSKDTAESKIRQFLRLGDRQTSTKVLPNLRNASLMDDNERFILSDFHLKGSSLNHCLMPDRVFKDDDLWNWSQTQL